MASELFVKVPGPITHEIALGPLDAPPFTFGGSVPLALSVRNRGNVHEDYTRPHALVARADGRRITFPDFTVLGGSTRIVEAEWVDPPLLCVCEASVRTGDGRGHAITRQARVVIVPFREIIGVLIAALGLVLLTRGGRRFHRSRLDSARREGYELALHDSTPQG
ncbi:MAG: hypothetical protein ACRDPK_00395 [Carbonactinosporaceae bacterium]